MIFHKYKYLLISTALHGGIILAIISPFLLSYQNIDFISLNNQIPVQIVVQKKTAQKSVPKKKDGISKDKPSENMEEISSAPMEETIVESQYVANIKYSILKSTEPTYPKAVSRMNLKQKVVIKTRLLVDKSGNIMAIEFLASDIDSNLAKYFQQEIRQAVSSWQFSPITIDNTPVSIYFYKDFVFING
ncbi:MAG: energy transducer TonB [Alphaproteobacteria bacterium]|jgi:predicted nucleotidyltransferase|nr:energy transducer TonB [Alphaproteobacteria bacterium]